MNYCRKKSKELGWKKSLDFSDHAFSHLCHSCYYYSFRKADHPSRGSKEGQAGLILLATTAVDASAKLYT